MSIIPLRYQVAQAIYEKIKGNPSLKNTAIVNPEYSPPDPHGDEYRGEKFILIKAKTGDGVVVSTHKKVPELSFCGRVTNEVIDLLVLTNSAIQSFLPPEVANHAEES